MPPAASGARKITLSHDSVWDLVLEASGLGSADIFVVVVFGLYTRFGGGLSAIASLSTGVITWIWAAHVAAVDHPFLTSLAAAFAAYVLPALPALLRDSAAR